MRDHAQKKPSPLGKTDPFLLAKTDPRMKQDLEQGGGRFRANLPEGRPLRSRR
jgi:hypothetical protein